MTDLRTHWMRTVHEALCGLSAKRLMLGERIIGGECATADVTCHGCRAVLRLAAMDAAVYGPHHGGGRNIRVNVGAVRVLVESSNEREQEAAMDVARRIALLNLGGAL